MSVDGEPDAALIVEDQLETRAALAATVREAFLGIEVDEATDLRSGSTLVEAGRAYRLALVDLGLPDGSGVALVRRIAETHPDTVTIVTTIYDDDEHLFSAIAAGAAGYVLKDRDPQMLSRHLRQLDAGVPALSPSIARKILAWFRAHPPAVASPRPEASEPPRPAATPAVDVTPHPSLSPRETEVLSLIGRGLRVAEVASVLRLSEQTVATYVKTIYRKLDISSRAEAALEAARRGLT